MRIKGGKLSRNTEACKPILYRIVMPTLSLKANYKPIREYDKQLKKYAKLGHSHEGAVKDTFTDVLKACGKQFICRRLTLLN